jgi:hypothetical protein
MTKRKDPKDIKPSGRPILPYDDSLGRQICEAIATSTEPLVKILAANPDFPSEYTIRQWRFTYPTFSLMYVDAKRIQADLLAEQIIEISDDASNDYKKDAKGNDVVDYENIQRSRLRVDSRKWLAGKLANKLYGDKTTVEQHVISHEQSIKDLA